MIGFEVLLLAIHTHELPALTRSGAPEASVKLKELVEAPLLQFIFVYVPFTI